MLLSRAQCGFFLDLLYRWSRRRPCRRLYFPNDGVLVSEIGPMGYHKCANQSRMSRDVRMSRVCETKLDIPMGIASNYIQEYISLFSFWVVMARRFWRKLQ